MAKDPMELQIEGALLAGGYKFEKGEKTGALDFYLVHVGVFIEVKQFHSDRIAEQMASQKNVIAVQGKYAVNFLAKLLAGDTEKP